MAQNQIPLDPIQAQLIKTAQTGTASTTSGPAYTQNVFGTRSPAGTGLVEGLRAFSKALGSASEVAKQRKFAEDMVTAGIFAAKNEVAPGLTSQKALLHNYNLLDENYTNRILNQVEVYDNNTASNISNHVGLTTEQKGIQHRTFIDQIKQEATNNVTHNGEALGNLLVKLDGYQHKWEVDIAYFDMAQRMQTAMENVSTDIQKYSTENKGYTLKYIKSLANKLKDTELQHNQRNVGTKENPKFIRAELAIDYNKAVFSLLKEQVVDSYRWNPELYESLLERIDDYYRPFAIKENALITAGKQDAIGDHQTFQSLFDGLESDIIAQQKIQTDLDKKGTANWFRSWIAPKLENNVPWNGDLDTTLFSNIFGSEASTWINKAKVMLTADKRGTHSPEFIHALELVQNGTMRTEEQLQGLVQQFHLNNDAGSKLSRLISQFKGEFKENITILQDASIITDGRMSKVIQNTWLQNLLAPLIKAEGFTFKEMTKERWVERFLLVKNKVKWPDEINHLWTTLQREVANNRGAIRLESQMRVYDEVLAKKYGYRTFAPEEASAWVENRTELILQTLESLGEWEVVEEKQNGTLVKVLKKKEVKKGSK